MLTMATNIFNVFDFGLTGVFLFIDSIVYLVVAQLFNSFTFLASQELIQQNLYQEIAERI